MKRFYLIPLLLLVFAGSSAQTLRGRISDQSDGKPLEFVNVGVLHRGTGSVTDQDGVFSFRVDSVLDTDTLRVSMLGYTTVNMTVSEFRSRLREEMGGVALSKSFQEMRTATIHSRELKERKLGNKNDGAVQAGFSSNDLGCELVTRIDIKNDPTFIEKFNFY
ncbi:MAG: carboxypeptidase-like regulatory domain-containing protein, partial [Bacteroidia bacterium]